MHPTSRRNLLSGQSSPYLLQHADNPVHWRPWGREALGEASEANRPILLSVGYAACHWCHVMAHESFENPEIAALMNEHFVNVKVDREERPDVDQVYMAALHAMGEQGGWPLTMFLTPDGRPFWGGTYFPPVAKHGRPGFAQILQAIARAWQEDTDNVEKNAAALHRHLSELSVAPETGDEPAAANVESFAARLLQLADPVHGGIRGAPKFPNAPMSETWLRAAGADGQSPYAAAFLLAMERISQGGIYDHLGGGIARYATDETWLVPHFEKMLYDNAHYIRQLAHAFRLDSRPLFRVRIEETIGWLEREMRMPGGAFASSLDADSEGEEGRFYVWSAGQIDAALGEDAPLFRKVYGVTEAGNFEGANILNRSRETATSTGDESVLERSRSLLLALRGERVRPGLDDKILADWNGYLIRALAEAGFALDRDDWIKLADTAYRFICESMSENHALSHSWRNGIQVRPALATDYGAMMNAAISLHAATGRPHYLETAGNWLAILRRDYADSTGGYYLTSAEAQDMAIRPRADNDEANPSGASQILEATIRLSRLTGDADLLDAAHAQARNLYAAISGNAYGQAGLCNALHTLFRGRHVKLFVDTSEAARPWLDAIRAVPDPALTWQVILPGEPATHFAMDGIAPAARPAAILCSDHACSAPLATPADLSQALQPA